MERAAGACVEVLPLAWRPGSGLGSTGQAHQFFRERREHGRRVLIIPGSPFGRHLLVLGKVLAPQLPQSAALGFLNVVHGFSGVLSCIYCGARFCQPSTIFSILCLAKCCDSAQPHGKSPGRTRSRLPVAGKFPQIPRTRARTAPILATATPGPHPGCPAHAPFVPQSAPASRPHPGH